ncbi:Alpha-glucosides-binding periplasmic protein AglE precursor, partial [hydrothermal vent metagenome]
ARFAAAGYTVPETWDDLLALSDTMIADGNTPWCVGIESGGATGWTFTDWVEDLTLRFEGPEYYDQWVGHTIPFNNPKMATIWQTVLDLWNTPGAVFANSGSIAATSFGDNGQPLVDGKCFMHRQASFYSAFLPEGTPAADGSEGAVDVFYFPAVGDDKPVLGAGTLVSAFRDAPEVWAVMEYFASADYADARQRFQALGKGAAVTEGVLSGFLSPNVNADLSLYAPLEQSFLDILNTADVVRFDGSDLMPSEVGAGTFWTEGTSAVNGDKTIQEALDAIEASWP